jgi:hypothetical protein
MDHSRDDTDGSHEKHRHNSSTSRPRLLVAYGLVGLVVLAAVIGISVIFSTSSSNRGDAHINQATGSTNGLQPENRLGSRVPSLTEPSLATAARLADCELRLNLTDEGHRHLPPSAPTPKYRTSPPTSGDHVEAPFQQADGAYSQSPDDIDVVHSLEHGRLAIQYRPSLPESAQLELIEIYDTMYGATLLFPNDRMHYLVAATTWRHLLGCNRYMGSITLDAIRDFGRATWGRYGGQPVNTFETTAPTPVEPALEP